ncbi:hypothetical protein KZC51_05985 [Microbacterium sp. SSW1-49]|uniref:Uncharacterized protein n=1 Tax=Microbacterium croceum TaxID=2851645 RepID=A0ABT0FCA0_9MICO|nr:hypothetical protein [Microbacterium croceum]MCK2035681.1 hypothetical protein [Microbacterium croceum]
MELSNHDEIITAIHDLAEVHVSFRSKEDGGAILTRRCAPMDFAPRARANDKTPCYHFWDFESDSPRNHVLSLPASQILSVRVLNSTFDPSAFVTWTPNWFVTRSTWGSYN